MKLGIIISVSEPETAWNALRLAQYALKEGDAVKVFFMGAGVDAVDASTDTFNVRDQAEAFLRQGGTMLACGTCLKVRQKESSEVCPLSTMKDLYELIRDSDRVATF